MLSFMTEKIFSKKIKFEIFPIQLISNFLNIQNKFYLKYTLTRPAAFCQSGNVFA
jgi:hypothetical protein